MTQKWYQPTRRQCLEFGLMAVLVCLAFALYLNEKRLVKVAFVLGITAIVVPKFFYPLAALWWGLARVMNFISTNLLLGLLFLLIVTPIGLVRRLMGKDSLRLRQFGKGKSSVMIQRNHTFTRDDLRNTF